MKCEICGERDAKRAINKKVDGAEKELYVCDECAQASDREKEQAAADGAPDIGKFLPDAMIDGLIKEIFQAGEAVAAALENPTAGAYASPCPSCGMTMEEFNRSQRLGCPQCYSHFHLAPLVHSMHPGVSHVGKVPESPGRAANGKGKR